MLDFVETGQFVAFELLDAGVHVPRVVLEIRPGPSTTLTLEVLEERLDVRTAAT